MNTSRLHTEPCCVLQPPPVRSERGAGPTEPRCAVGPGSSEERSREEQEEQGGAGKSRRSREGGGQVSFWSEDDSPPAEKR
ncbi:uncharacterized protein V6R79_002705 [Siganus canaliculatus]